MQIAFRDLPAIGNTALHDALVFALYQLRVHPAAKAIHHAFRGGLLEHVVSMMELAVKFADHYPELDRDLLVLGVLFHDLGKLQELGAMPDNEYTPVGRLVGHIVLGRDLVRDRARDPVEHDAPAAGFDEAPLHRTKLDHRDGRDHRVTLRQHVAFRLSGARGV